jgi:hypothetical protein
VAAEPLAKIVEQNVGAKARRQANGTYTLEELPGGGTRIEFEYRWQRAALTERLAAPLARHGRSLPRQVVALRAKQSSRSARRRRSLGTTWRRRR